jgi:hypothetical protein
MKKLLLSALFAFPIGLSAQQINMTSPASKFKVDQEEVEAAKASVGASASRSSQTIYVDYPVADEIEQGSGEVSNFLWTFNSTYTAQDTGIIPINFVGVRLLNLTGYSDPLSDPIETYAGPFPYPNDLTVTVDSIFILLAHENNTGENDTLLVDLRKLSAAGNFSTTQPIVWTDSIITATALSPSGNWLGTNALYAASIPCGYSTALNEKIGIALRYIAPKSDTLGILAGYIPNPNSPAPPNDFALKSLFPYSVVRWDGFSNGNFSNTTNIFYNLQAGQTDTSWFKAQNWQIWTQLTFEDVTGLKETVRMPFGAEQNMPNPFSIKSSIPFTVNDAQAVTLEIYSLQGVLVKSSPLGFKSQGKYTEDLNANEFAPGTYMYRIVGDKSTSIMKKMIVTH